MTFKVITLERDLNMGIISFITKLINIRADDFLMFIIWELMRV